MGVRQGLLQGLIANFTIDLRTNGDKKRGKLSDVIDINARTDARMSFLGLHKISCWR